MYFKSSAFYYIGIFPSAIKKQLSEKPVLNLCG